MDKVLAEKLLADIEAAPSDVKAALQFLKDSINLLLAESRELDAKLSTIVKEADEKKRAVIAAEIKKMMSGLLGEDCSTLAVTPQGQQ